MGNAYTEPLIVVSEDSFHSIDRLLGVCIADYKHLIHALKLRVRQERGNEEYSKRLLQTYMHTLRALRSLRRRLCADTHAIERYKRHFRQG